MGIPKAFLETEVAAAKAQGAPLFADFMASKEPYASLFRDHPWLRPPKLNEPLPSGGDHYWETAAAVDHPDWQGVDLPQPTKDFQQLRHDFGRWGYGLIEDGLSKAQCDAFLNRLLAQANAEAAAGIAHQTPSGQYVPCLINKGDCFRGCIEQDPEHVQAGPLIEAMLNETLGEGWICHSFLANGADPGGYPQGLHIDQAPLLPWVTEAAPALVNTMFIPQDVDADNGGTLVIPGSHQNLIRAGSGGALTDMPRPINLKAPAGTIMLFDGRLWHGTGINRTDQRRFVATMSNVKPWMRQQENWVVSTLPEIIDAASPKLLHRLGMQALTYGATVEGFGLGASGRQGDQWGNIQAFRQAMDRGDYRRVGQLPDPRRVSQEGFTIKDIRSSAKNPL